MAASTKILATNNCTQNEDWTVVVPRRGKQRRNFQKVRPAAKQEQLWFPDDVECDQDRQSKLMQKMQISLKKVENSQFYQDFLEQIQSPKIVAHFHRVIGSELKMQMVIYGIGSIESFEAPRLQLSLALLMKRDSSLIDDIEVFDPVLSATESRVLESFGCSVLSLNEQGRRCVKKPTIFYMPHCEAELYSNLLQANWGLDLNRIALFGNSFGVYQFMSELNSTIVNSSSHILAVRKFTDEYNVKTPGDDYFAAFHDSSWHFFSPGLEAELQQVTN